jgi:hypothetical protein
MAGKDLHENPFGAIQTKRTLPENYREILLRKRASQSAY